jgi:hypothetical protein
MKLIFGPVSELQDPTQAEHLKVTQNIRLGKNYLPRTKRPQEYMNGDVKNHILPSLIIVK